MNPTQWAAWVGACSGVGSLLWNIYMKLSAGPKLEVRASAGMVKSPSPPDDPKFLKIIVHNRGTAPTTVNNVTFHSYDSSWDRIRSRNARFSAVLGLYEGSPYPRPLEVGGEWAALVKQDGKLEELIASSGLWVAIHHSFAKKPTQVKVIEPRA